LRTIASRRIIDSDATIIGLLLSHRRGRVIKVLWYTRILFTIIMFKFLLNFVRQYRRLFDNLEF